MARAAISSVPYSSQNRNVEKKAAKPRVTVPHISSSFNSDVSEVLTRVLTDGLTGKQLYINNPLLSLMTLYPAQHALNTNPVDDNNRTVFVLRHRNIRLCASRFPPRCRSCCVGYSSGSLRNIRQKQPELGYSLGSLRNIPQKEPELGYSSGSLRNITRRSQNLDTLQGHYAIYPRRNRNLDTLQGHYAIYPRRNQNLDTLQGHYAI